MEVAKTRMAVAEVGKYRGITHCMSSVARYEGVRGASRTD